MLDSLSKRPRRFFVNTQRGIDLHLAICRITRLDWPQPSWDSVLRHQRFLSSRLLFLSHPGLLVRPAKGLRLYACKSAGRAAAARSLF
jgi:hypothetical protein